MLLQMALFACIGVAFEVVFTAVSDWPKTRSARLMGRSYVWMLPIYALVPLFLRALHPVLGGWWLPARLALYVTLLLMTEYATGWLLRQALGQCPWEPGYLGKRWSVHGLVRLDYVPVWALAAFLFERFYLALRTL